MEVNFYNYGIIGAKLHCYLLEKSRVVSQQTNERNFHIFYQICNGTTSTIKANYTILQPSQYYYLNQSNCLTINGIKDSNNFNNTKECMETIGLSKDEIKSVIQMIVGILYLGNIDFDPKVMSLFSLLFCCLLSLLSLLILIQFVNSMMVVRLLILMQ